MLHFLMYVGSAPGQQPAGGLERPADDAAPSPVAERLVQLVAVVRLRLHPQGLGLAQSERQSDRRAGQLLRNAGRLPTRAFRHRPQ